MVRKPSWRLPKNLTSCASNSREQLFHDVEKPHFLLWGQAGCLVSAALVSGLQCRIKGLRGIAKHRPMGEIARRQRAHRVRQIAQDVGEQSVVEMHADRFANVILAGAVQAERDAGLIEMSVETRRWPRTCRCKACLGIPPQLPLCSG